MAGKENNEEYFQNAVSNLTKFIEEQLYSIERSHSTIIERISPHKKSFCKYLS